MPAVALGVAEAVAGVGDGGPAVPVAEHALNVMHSEIAKTGTCFISKL